MQIETPGARLSLESMGQTDAGAHSTLICASCGQETDAVPCAHCGRSPLLGGRYRLHERAAEDGMGLTCLGTDMHRAGRPVQVRLLPVGPQVAGLSRQSVPTWMQAMGRITHPVVRTWLDGVWIGSGNAGALAIVQQRGPVRRFSECAPGPLSPVRTKSVLMDVLEALAVLHASRPTISSGPLHPDRLGMGDGERAVILHPVFLDAFCDVALPVVWEPPELARGAWSPASDVFRAGVLGACLLTGRTPADLASDPDWSATVTGADAIVGVLHGWLQPDPSHRPASASMARQQLREVARHPRSGRTAPEPDSDSLDMPVGVAAIRIHPGAAPVETPLEPVRAKVTISPEGRPRVSASVRPPVATVRSGDGLVIRGVSGLLLLLLLLVGLVTMQIALTSTGILDGEPWIPMGAARRALP